MNIFNKKFNLISILILAFAVLVSIIAYFKLFDKSDFNKFKPDIKFSSIDNDKADSIIETMSLDEMLELLLLNKDSIQNNIPTEVQLNQQITIINNANYINAVSDTLFINNLIQKISTYRHSKAIIFSLTEFELNNLTDSNFTAFYLKRYRRIKRIANNKNKLLGFKIGIKQLKTLQNQVTDTNYFSKYLYEEIVNRTDVVLVDSCTNNEDIAISGLGILNIIDTLTSDDKLISILEGKLDLLYFHKQNIKDRIKSLIDAKKYSEKKLRERVRKLVKAKMWQENINSSIASSYNQIKDKLMYQYLAEKSMCLLNNTDSLFPLNNNIYNKKNTVVYLGEKINKTFKRNIEKYINPSYTSINKISRVKRLKSLKKSNIIFMIDTLLNDSNLQALQQSILLNIPHKNTIIVNFANHKNLELIPDSFCCLQTQGRTYNDYKFAAQAIFGAIPLSGVLPFTINEKYKFGTGYKTLQTRLKYTIPEDAEIDSERLSKIDQIALEGIRAFAYPACQIFIAKNGKVIYNKNFGYHTYDEEQVLKSHDIFDLASVTKIAATTVATMKMISDNNLNINDKLKKYFKDTHIDYTRIKTDTLINIDTFDIASISDWKVFLEKADTINISDTSFITVDTILTKLEPKNNIFEVPIIDLLRHKSGILPSVPVFRYIFYKTYFLQSLKKQEEYKQALQNIHYQSFNISKNFPDDTNMPDSLNIIIKQGFKNQYDKYFIDSTSEYIPEIQLSDKQYFKGEYFDTIWRDIKQLPVYSRKVMQYSDVNMVLLQMAIDSLNNQSIDKYLKSKIYKDLGLEHITYSPLNYYAKDNILPTEFADNWRKGLLQGFVHDPSAALLGGVAGNAGLFSNAHDLGVLFQMILNKGKYGGQQFIKPQVIEQFTKRNDDTQRALGFDMPNRKAIVGSKASKNTYGHSGYTGTCVWVDPNNQLVYVFLSNRNYPSSENWRIVNHHIRERIHNAIYDAINKR